jgi:hypothetical protein
MLPRTLEMFTLQARLNDDTNGPEWRKGRTRLGKRVNWRRCIVMEGAELIDSVPWKHWKNVHGDLDMHNIAIEIVDIWHFVMSEMLRTRSPEEAAEAALAAKQPCRTHLPAKWSPEADEALDTLLAPFESLMRQALDPQTSDKKLCESFWCCADAAGVDFDTLYRLYIGKNALNHFRQRHGYKEGRYQKIWNGREDNAVMQSILQREPDLSFEALLARLETLYPASEGA